MRSNKLLNVVKLLSQDEWGKAEKFLKSEYFNTDKNVVTLFLYIKNIVPDWESPKLEKEKIYKGVFKSTDFRDHKLRKLQSKLVKLLEQFMVQQNLENTPNIFKRLLIQYLAQKTDGYKFFEQEIELQIKELEKSTLRDAAYYQEMMWLEESYFFHNETPKFNLPINEYIQDLMEKLDVFFSLVKLRYSLELITRGQLLSKTNDIEYLSEVMERAESLSLKNPVIGLFKKIIELFTIETDEEHLNSCLEGYKANAAKLGSEEKSMIITALINFSMARSNSGDPSFANMALEWYKLALSEEIFINEDRINTLAFTNIAVLSAHCHDFDWSKDFIRIYGDKLDDSNKENAKNLAWAFWNYQYGKHYHDDTYFEEALSKLNKITYQDEVIDLRMRSLQLRIDYDYFLGKDEGANILLDHANAFEKYIRRNGTISKKRADSYLNFILTTKKLAVLKITPEIKEDRIKKILQTIQQFDSVVLRFWLLEKVEELK